MRLCQRAIHRERSFRVNLARVDARQPHIRDQSPRPRRRIFPMGVPALQTIDPPLEPVVIVINKYHVVGRISIRKIGGRDHIARIRGEEFQPLPSSCQLVEIGRLFPQEMLYGRSRRSSRFSRLWGTPYATEAPTLACSGVPPFAASIPARSGPRSARRGPDLE